MNSVILTGYLATEPELKTTNSGIEVCSFNIAVKRPHTKEKTDFFNVISWRQTAEFVSKYFRKGSGIEILGSIITEEWQDDNGNNHKTVKINAEQVDFGKKSEKGKSTLEQHKIENNGNSGDFTAISDFGDDGDLPF
ncbi:MAG: single-stranded DNA-binding protein [Candidatus Fimenecus sp.]